jgi:hypothetical protein
VLRLIGAELRRRRGRALALIAGVAVATAAFTVLTGASRTARLEARGEVAHRFRTAYDVLVRPHAARAELERRDGLVQSAALSSLTGGISMAQLRAVRDIPGVDVAAPLAVFGQVVESVPVTIPVQAPRGRRSLYRARIRWTADGGLTRIADPDSYTYITPRRLTLDRGGSQADDRQEAIADEALPGGRLAPVCPFPLSPDDALRPFSRVVREKVDCWSTQTGLDGLGRIIPDNAPSRIGVTVRFAFAMPIAGVDPVAEARLSGLPRARTSGRFLLGDDAPRLRHVGIGRMEIPVVVSRDLPSSVSARVQVERLPDRLAERIPAVADARGLRRLLARAPGRRDQEVTIGARQAYGQLITSLRTPESVASWPAALWTVGPVRYRAAGQRRLQALPAPSQDDQWGATLADDSGAGYLNPPITASDVPFRTLEEHLFDASADHPVPTLRVVGTFSPERAPQAGAVLDPFTVPPIEGASPATRAALGGRPLRPDGNPAGLVGLPPMMLTTLAARRVLFNDTYVDGGGEAAARPLALIRVRVADVHGADAASRERIRLVADRIHQRTGLDVDITAGASPTTVRVDVPAGRFGRPALALDDPWVLKGVAVSILRAVDRKSVLLFSLVLVVCLLFCLSAAAAAVRQRTTELGVLACLGWPRRALLQLLLTEVTVLGLAAGVAGLAIAVPVGAAFGLSVTAGRAALAVPGAVLVTVGAALVPLIRATRADPLNAVRPPARAPRRRGGARSIVRLAAANTLAVPGRAVLGAASLAVGVFALTMLLGVTLAFRGAVVGTVLGDAVSVQLRGIDYVSVGVTLALGVFGLADVLYLNVRDRAAELAALRATGWPEAALARLVALEGVMIGAGGGLAGGALGLLATRLFTGHGVADLLAPAALGVTAGAACAALAAVAPLMSLRRLPTARLLAEE